MAKTLREEALLYHEMGKPGKIEVIPTKPHSTQKDLALAYSPGVAEPCLEIEKDLANAYKYTSKGNLVAVISNGTAVLGLGDIGALAGKPVMEGKGLLFKIFAGIDVFDIEINEKDPKKFIEIVKAIAPTFGGINLEDIKAPECFEIEDTLKAECDIPLMHDDQHGTAIISSAALLNGLIVSGKKIEEVKIVVNGAGASASSCTRLYHMLGAKKENIVMCDSKGVIRADRAGLTESKKMFATTRDIHTLNEALVGADVFLGLSVANVLNKEMVQTMAKDPIVFALANPNPEISYEEAMASREDIIFATGRSDHPNQVNNVLGFPFIFRGALDSGACTINEEMKLAAVYAIAELARKPVPNVVNAAYNVKRLSFGREYLIPKPLDPRLLTTVAPAVAKAAMESGVAKRPIQDWAAYEKQLLDLMGGENKLSRQFMEAAKQSAPKRIVFAEANHENMLRAAVEAMNEGICKPILLGNDERIEKLAKELDLDIAGAEIVNLRHDREEDRRNKYAAYLTQKRGRDGMTLSEAREKMNDRNYFGMMMVEMGDADAMVTGNYTKYCETVKIAKEVIGVRPEYNTFATMHIVSSKKGTFFLADTQVNRHPSTEVLIDVARMANHAVKFFAHDPVMAMVSYSNFGADEEGSPASVRKAVKYLHENHPDMVVDGEMQINMALNGNLRDEKFPFNKLKGKEVNTLIFPNLSSANTAYKLLSEMGGAVDSIGPIQIGLQKPIYFTEIESCVRDILNLVVVAVLDATVQEGNKL